MKNHFIIVGENIHCTRVRLTSGRFVTALPEGRFALPFQYEGRARHLPIPPTVVAGEEWAAGKVRHVAVAVFQGLRGSEEERQAGKAYLQSMARAQEEHGTHFLDLNVDEFSMDPEEKQQAMSWVADVVQQASTLPLSIDSSNPALLETGLNACDRARGKPLLNSVSLERAALIPIAAAANAKVIAGASGADRMPETVQDRMQNFAALTALLKTAGIVLEDTYLDPLVFPVSVDATNGLKVIDTICAAREQYGPAVHFAPGLSNVSYGLPRRPLINQVFASLCQAHGCDGGIVDPAQINDRVLSAIDPQSPGCQRASALLCGHDEYGMDFITAAREGTI